MKLAYCAAVFLALIFSGSCSHSSAHDRLNGTWTSDLMTVTIDFPAQKYSGVAMGQPFSQSLTLVSEQANVVTFQTNATTIVCQIQENGDIMLTKQGAEGGIPILLHRAHK